jgi:hypothetical protein
MGVNLNMDEKGFPRAIRVKATSLKRKWDDPFRRRAFAVLLLEGVGEVV